MKDEPFRLTRRKALGGLATIGVAGAGAGLGTSALFSDEEVFTDNNLTAGELDLFVDYDASVDQDGVDTGSTTGSGTIDGNPASGEYVINDVKPGDSGSLTFCPKIVDNPAWLWVGGSGVIDRENGQPEPETGVDPSGGDPGYGAGELAESILVTVSYCEEDGTVIRELNNPADYSLADLGRDLLGGFLVDGSDAESGTQAYPGSPDASTQTGPCLCVDWEVPLDVGNEIQTDSVAFDVQFAAIQERHNPSSSNPFATGQGFSAISWEKALNMQALAEGGSGRGEIQIHGDSGNVENDTVFGTTLADDFPVNTDVGFTAEVDSGAGTASLTVNGVTVTDTDVTDGTANGGSTADLEWPGGVPSSVDVAINAHSGGGVTTVVKDIQVNGSPTAPDVISEGAAGGNTYLPVLGADATGTLTVTGNIRFEGSQSDYTTQDWVGIDFR